MTTSARGLVYGTIAGFACWLIIGGIVLAAVLA